MFQSDLLQEPRFRMMQQVDPARSQELMAQAQQVAISRFDYYKQLAGLQFGSDDKSGDAN